MVHIDVTQPMNKCHVNKLSQKLTYERHHLFFHFLYKKFGEFLLIFLFSNLHLQKRSPKNSQFLCWKNGEILSQTKHCFVGFLIIRLTINGAIKLMQPFSLLSKVCRMSYRVCSSLGSRNVLKFVEGIFINCSRPLLILKSTSL